MGLAAVKALLLLAVLLGGCRAAPEVAGVVAGAITGGATGNPAVGFAVGVGTVAAGDFLYKYESRRWHRSEQDAIAETAGALDIGHSTPWQVRHDLPLGNEHGTLEVVRLIDNPLASCKQVVFSVDDDDVTGRWYAADICREDKAWKWASAEPAVERWGYLQ